MIHLVVFTWQGRRFGVEAVCVAGMGMAAQLLPGGWRQLDLSVLGLNPSSAEDPGSYLQFRGGRDARVLLLEQGAQLMAFDTAHIHPLPTILEQTKQHPCIKGLAWLECEPVLLLEPALLPTL